MKMSRAQKEKLGTYTEAPLQLTPENPTEESTITAADNYHLNASLLKTKQEADKPLYLKRI